MLCVLLMQGCRERDRAVDDIPTLSPKEWTEYYSIALKAYNDSGTWKACGKALPLEFSLHTTKSMEPWGKGFHGNKLFDSVVIHIPVMDVGKEGKGVPHVNLYFQHPEKVITNITVSHIMF